MRLIITVLLTLVSSIQGQTPITYTLEEETTTVTPLGNIIQNGGLQLPQDNSIYFTILPVDQDLHQLFSVDQNGDFRRSKRVDRDSICPQSVLCEIELDIQVNPLEFFQIVKVVVEVTDINDEVPTFAENIYKIQVSEAARLESTISLPRAKDLDSPENGVVTYREANLDTLKFELTTGSSNEPVLLIKDTLDREDTPSYQFILLAADSQAPDTSASATVSIDLLDINDNFPQFTKELYEVSTYEKVKADESLVQVSASDRDSGENGRVFYYLSPITIETYGAVFSVDEESGDVRTNGQLDYETTKEALLTVIARNREPTSPSSQARVSVRVIDINDESPSIKVIEEPPGGIFTIPENASLPTFVAHIKVSDPDTGEGGLFTCTLDNDNFALVKLYDTDFKVVTNQLFDREVQAEYKTSVTCTDKGQPALSSSRELSIQLSDVNDHQPVCQQSPFTAEVVENESSGANVLVTVTATDEDINDNGRLSYSIAAGPASVTARRHLRVNSQTGDITLVEPLNYEQIKLLSFNVTVSDHGDPGLTSDCTVSIKVIDRDDEYPLFDEVVYEMKIPEENLPGASVGEVKAKDLDSNAFNSFTYSFVNSSMTSNTGILSLTGGFIIDPISGKITVNVSLDREMRANYTLSVQAVGIGPNAFKSFSTVEVIITDINDNSPFIIFPTVENSTVFVKRVLNTDSYITRIIATDLDQNENSRLNYHILSGDDDGILAIDSTSGVITCSRQFSAPDTGYQIQALIHVTDSGHPQLSNSTYLLIDFSLAGEPVPLIEQSSARNANIVIIIAVLSGILMVILVTAIFCLLRQRNRGKKKQTKIQTISQDVPTVYTSAPPPQPSQHGIVNKGLTAEFDEVTFQQPDTKQKSDSTSSQQQGIGSKDDDRDGESQESTEKPGECGSEASDSGHGSNEESSSLPGTLRRWDNRLLTAAVTRQESIRLQTSQSFRSDSTTPPALPPRKRRTSQSFQYRLPPTDPCGSGDYNGATSQALNTDFPDTSDNVYIPEYTPSSLEGLEYMYDHPKYHPYPSDQPPPPYFPTDIMQYSPTPPPPVFHFTEETDNNENSFHHKEEFVDFMHIPGYNPYSDDVQEPQHYNEQRIYAPDEVFDKDELLLFGASVESTTLPERMTLDQKKDSKYCSQV